MSDASLMIMALNTAAEISSFPHDICIIDEAGQSLEMDCPIPLRNPAGKNYAPVDDKTQLASRVLSSNLAERNEFHDQMMLSLSERLKRDGLPHVLLKQQ